MRFIVWPKSNQLTAIGNVMDGFSADHSRGVEAATAASTHAGHKEAEQEWSSVHRGQPHRRNLQKITILSADLDDQLNFEFARNKNSMNVFMIRLRRVYQA
jgi:hypothetical protein